MNSMPANTNNLFLWSRFVRVFRNDFAQQSKRLWIASLATVGVGLIIYLTNLDPRGVYEPELFQVLFPLALIGGGMLFTSAIFNDLHHPLQRFHYLTLPCSNLERFLSRYLLTGPLFLVYLLAGYALFDAVAAQLANALLDTRATSFKLTAAPVWQSSVTYLLMHAVMLLGAVYYRSYALIKTALVGTLLITLIGFVQIIAIRLTFWKYFTGVFPDDNVVVLPAQVYLQSPAVLLGLLFLLHLWVLYLAYATLCDHEVQDEL